MNISILILSCSVYKSLWNPNIKLLKKYWPDCEIPIYICSKKIEGYISDIPLIETNINDERPTNFIIRLYDFLKKVKTEYVFTIMDKQMLCKKVDNYRIMKLIDIINKNKDIKAIKINRMAKGDIFHKEDILLSKYAKNQPYSCSFEPTIWNKKFLMKLCEYCISLNKLRHHDYELNGSEYINKTKSIILGLTNFNEQMRRGGGGCPYMCFINVSSNGHLNPPSKLFFKKENIQIDTISDNMFSKIACNCEYCLTLKKKRNNNENDWYNPGRYEEILELVKKIL